MEVKWKEWHSEEWHSEAVSADEVGEFIVALLMGDRVSFVVGGGREYTVTPNAIYARDI